MGAPGGHEKRQPTPLSSPRSTTRRTRMPRVGRCDGVDSEGADGVDSQLIVLVGCEAGHGGGRRKRGVKEEMDSRVK